MSILSIRDLHKSYTHGNTTTPVLKGINLDIEVGSFVSILGRSGSGKTTLLNVVSTLLEFEQGEILIDGHNVSDLKQADINTIRNNYIGFVFQDFNLVKDMTVLDNVATPLILNGVPFKIAREKAEAALELVGLDQYTKVRPVELSGGQQQRVAIARAIVNDQQIILCDEPTGALDDTTAVEILELLQILSETKTVIMVTHDEEFAKKFSDRIIVLVDGVILKDQKVKKTKKVKVEKRELNKKRAGIMNLFRYSFASMHIDKKKFGSTFRTFSISLMLFIVVSIINENIDVFTRKYLNFIEVSEVNDKNILLDFIYQFLEQNITQLINVILIILLGFCIVSYLFVFTINILNKKKEIAVLKAFGASQREISIMFMLRPIRFTFSIFKDTMIYTFIAMLLINNFIDFKSIIVADYLQVIVNMITVLYGVIASFITNISISVIDFHIHYSHIFVLFITILGLFMVGSLIPAYRISKSNTIRMLAKE